MDALRWIVKNGGRLAEDACSDAAGAGQLGALKLLRASHCPWDEIAPAEAAKGGHVEIVFWARANGCPGDGAKTCAGAAEAGNLPLLQYLRAKGAAWGEKVCAGAAAGGHLTILQYLRSEGCAPRPPQGGISRS